MIPQSKSEVSRKRGEQVHHVGFDKRPRDVLMIVTGFAEGIFDPDPPPDVVPAPMLGQR
jgi:hypothetical protein